MINFNKLEKYKKNNQIEVKKAIGGLPKSIWATYSSFANAMGNTILFGVAELNNKTYFYLSLKIERK